MNDDEQFSDTENSKSDELSDDQDALDAELETSLRGTARRLEMMNNAIEPDTQFVSRLEMRLFSVRSASTGSNGMVTTVPTHMTGFGQPTPTLSAEKSPRKSRFAVYLAVAATVLIAALAGIAGYQGNFSLSDSSGNENNNVIVAAIASPESSLKADCDVPSAPAESIDIAATPAHHALLTATTMISDPNDKSLKLPAMQETDLPTGDSIDASEVPGIEKLVQQLVACRNAGDYVSMDALYNRDSFIRTGVTPAIGTPQATPFPENLASVDVPTILDTRELSDGRVGVLLSHDINGAGLRQFLILVRQDDTWLVDETVLVTSEVNEIQLSPIERPPVVHMGDFYFKPDSLSLFADTPTAVTLVNEGTAVHHFSIEELGIDISLKGGESTVIEIDAPAGDYTFVSDVPGQQAAGMEGTLSVIGISTPVVD